MGMHREAEMIEQQLKAKQAAANVVVGGVGPGQGQQAATTGMTGGGAGQTADYSAQWAEYYRSIGKIDEAEAIEKQMKVNTRLFFCCCAKFKEIYNNVIIGCTTIQC